jgi:hypothetical protein
MHDLYLEREETVKDERNTCKLCSMSRTETRLCWPAA